MGSLVNVLHFLIYTLGNRERIDKDALDPGKNDCQLPSPSRNWQSVLPREIDEKMQHVFQDRSKASPLGPSVPSRTVTESWLRRNFSFSS